MMIKIEDFTYCYPHSEQPAVQDVSLEVAAGEFVLLSGPSGAGKSTLLRAVGGLVPHFSGGRVAGRVEVAGRDALREGPPVLSRYVGFVFQNPEAQAVLEKVEDEVAFGLENAGMPAAEMRLRVEEALDLAELTALRKRSLRTLSGGERQRVAIAAALALRPRVLALDEPTSQLDPQSAQDVLEALRRLNEDLGLTVLLVEHRLERALRYADRVVALEQGRIVVDGPLPEQLPYLAQLPPLAELGRQLGWSPLPRTIKEARALAPSPMLFSDPVSAPLQGRENGAGSRPALEIKNLHFAYGRAPVLQKIDLKVAAGEAVVLMGRNGSGKTTLLRCVVGLLEPQKGEVVVAGRSTSGQDTADICRQVAYLPQTPDDLLFAESVWEELAITLHNHGINETAVRVPAMLERLGLGECAQAYPRDLSVGQRQRVALGAVMITRPPLLLLDEPTRGLDATAKQALVTLWRRWLADGVGLLLVTHDVELAAQIADRVVVLSQGEIIADGTPERVLSNSSLFAPQISRLFPGTGWLTLEHALAGLGRMQPTP